MNQCPVPPLILRVPIPGNQQASAPMICNTMSLSACVTLPDKTCLYRSPGDVRLPDVSSSCFRLHILCFSWRGQEHRLRPAPAYRRSGFGCRKTFLPSCGQPKTGPLPPILPPVSLCCVHLLAYPALLLTDVYLSLPVHMVHTSEIIHIQFRISPKSRIALRPIHFCNLHVMCTGCMFSIYPAVPYLQECGILIPQFL